MESSRKTDRSERPKSRRRHAPPSLPTDSEVKEPIVEVYNGEDSLGEDDRDSTLEDPTFKPTVSRHKPRQVEAEDTPEEVRLIPEPMDPLSRMLEMMRMEQERRADREERMEEQRLKEASKREEILCNLIKQLDNGRKEDNRIALEKHKKAEEDRKEEREQREIRRAIPNLAPMTSSEDLQDFIELFEENQDARRVPKEAWAANLIPLLNSECKTAIAGLPGEDRYEYDVLKKELLASAIEETKYTSKSFLECKKKPGQTWRATANKIARLARRCADGDTVDEVRGTFIKEKLIQLMPQEIQAYVKEKDPKTYLNAADLAATYCSIHGIDQTRVDSSKPWTAEKRMTRNKEERSWKGKQHSYNPYRPAWKEPTWRERSGRQGGLDNRDSSPSKDDEPRHNSKRDDKKTDEKKDERRPKERGGHKDVLRCFK